MANLDKVELGIRHWGLVTGDWEDLNGDSDPNQILLMISSLVPNTGANISLQQAQAERECVL